jgi:hypothetical protein
MEATVSSECPVCGGLVVSADLNDHMASHAKEDIVAALLRQRSGTSSSSPFMDRRKSRAVGTQAFKEAPDLHSENCKYWCPGLGKGVLTFQSNHSDVTRVI